MKTTDCFDEVRSLLYPTVSEIDRLVLTPYARAKLMCYVHLASPYEITGFGRIVNGHITDVKILRQTVQNAKVDCDEEAMMEFLMGIPNEERNEWILDWHSHVDMETFHSSTDKANYKSQWEARLKKQYPTMVVNKQEEYFVNQYISPYEVVPIELLVNNTELDIDDLETVYKECREDVDKLCEVKVYTKEVPRTKHKYWWEQEEEEEKPKPQRQLLITDYFCLGCGEELVTEREITRGICSDCWEAMAIQDRIGCCKDKGLALNQV